MHKVPRLLAVFMSAALLATTLEAQQPAQAAPAEDPKPAVAKVDSRPDLVSAVVTARSQGARVEVESMRSETSTTWANPDGTMTTDAHTAPIRFKAANGAWQPIDLTLVKGADGTVAPGGHQLGLRLGKRTNVTGGVFASSAAGSGRQVEWLSPWKLPEPTLHETKATYADVQQGVDLTVDARSSGFEVDFIVKQRPATAPVWRIPLRTKGLTARQLKDGTIEFVDAKNVARARIPVSYMWDSVTDPTTKDPLNKAIVDVTIEQSSSGKATLVIAPDAKWLLDPARVFPVTVDPTYANTPVYSSFDTFVQSGYTSDLSSLVDLRAGKNGVTTERSFLNFPGAAFHGKDITSASLFLYQYGATTCTPTVMNLHAALPASTATRWTAQPVTSSTVWGSVSAAKGFSSACPGGRISVPMTSLAQYWADHTDATVGVALKAANEADPNAWKRFVSREGTADPYISLTWNRPPNEPAVVEPSEAVAYAAPGETTSSMYSSSLRPWVRTKATDPDANTVKYIYEFHTAPVNETSLKGTCTSSVYASGTTAGCRPSQDLPDNTLLYVRAKANDGRVDGPWTGYWARLRIGATPPAQPVVTCPAPYDVDNSWQDNAPTANVVCTVTATGTGYSAPGYIRLSVDGKPVPTNFTGGAAGQVKITPSSDSAVAKTTVTIPKTVAGLHGISAQAESPAGKLSGTASHSFGWGGAAMSRPSVEPRITTTGTVQIEASGPPKGPSGTVPTASLRWRLSGYSSEHETVGWNTVDNAGLTLTDNGTAGVTVSGRWDTTTAIEDASLDSDPNTAGVQPTALNDRLPALLDIQVCLTYASSTQCTWSESKTTVQRVPHAFDNGFPVADAGIGQVALWTGEFNLDDTDVSVPGYSGELTVSRSHSTYAGATDAINNVFGPGWAAHFAGTDAGVAGSQVVDSTRRDGTIAFIDSEGSALVWTSPTGGRRTTANYAAGAWVPADEPTKFAAAKFVVSGTGSATRLTYTEANGTSTVYAPSAVPTANADTLFRAISVSDPTSSEDTQFTYDVAGHIAKIIAPAPPGVSCPATGALNPGCRALRFEYGTSGDATGRLVAAWSEIYNPAKTGGPGMDAIKVAEYTYGTGGMLIKVSDPRSGLSTEYGYNAANHLSSVKPAGQVAYQLVYSGSGSGEKLSEVKRDRPAGDPHPGTATLARFVYSPDVPLSGAGLPDLSKESVARWNQKVVPANGFAVFGPDHPVSGTPTADDWQYADLQYTDSSGNTVNTLKYGAGAWQYNAIDYNDQGNVIRELDERAIRSIIDGQVPAGASADQLASLTVYNEDIKNAAGDVVLTAAGTLETDTYGPARFAALKDGTVRWVREHVRTVYDQAAPNGGIDPATTMPYRLATSQTRSAHDAGTGTDLEVVSRSLTDYDAPVSGDPDGWALSMPGKQVTDVDLDGSSSAGDIVKLSRYDSEGREIETRQPESNGSDAGTTKTVYYTVAANAAHPECTKPEWAGQICKKYPAAQPSTGSGSLTATLPTTTITGYSYFLQPTTVVESSGSVTRTTTTSYLLDGRIDKIKTTVTGLTGSTPIAEKKFSYDTATGLATVLTATAADSTSSNITTGYDAWGRRISYQPSGETAATTVYDTAGRIATVTDANGVTAYTYDGTDAMGATERRGLATKVDVTVNGVTWSSRGAYDAAESMTVQKLPGGITQITDLDNAGEPSGLRYTGQVTTVNDDGSTTVDPNGTWLSWSIDNDVTGRVTRERTPDGAAFTGAVGDAPGDANPYDRAYTYDAADRLATVKDRTASATGVDITDPTATPCVTRSYGFDRNDRRLTKATAGSGGDGACTTAGGASTTRAYDTADRPVTGANGQGSYLYDALGRTTTIPASDAPRPADGDITIGYYDNDLARSTTQGGSTTTYALDALDRRAIETTTTSAGTSQTQWHYADVSDNPTWVSNGSAIRRYVELVGGNLALTVNESGTAELMISNNHGDAVAGVQLAAPSATATGIDSWSSFDEYGRPLAASTSTDLVKYEWLGAHQRATSDPGLVLMGKRLYNPESGLFTSVDPVSGGNTNAYTYPTDPVTNFDLDGCWCRNYAYSSWYEYSRWYNFVPSNSWRSELISWATGLGLRGLYVISEIRIQTRLKWYYGSHVCNGRVVYKHYWHQSRAWYQYRIRYKRNILGWKKTITTYWGWLYP